MKLALLIKISYAIILLIALLHTFFLVFGVPNLPTSSNYQLMVGYMSTIQVDSGGGIMRTTQDFMDGFNIIVSIYLFTFSITGLLVFPTIAHKKGLNRLLIVSLLSSLAFFVTSLTLLAIVGTVLSGIASILLLIALTKNMKLHE